MIKPATTEENRRIREAGSPGTWDHGRQVVRSAIDGDICYPDYPENAALIAHAVNQLIPLSEERDRLREALLSYAEWCDSIARSEPDKGGQHVGTGTLLQASAARSPSIRVEFRRQADWILEILSHD
jgi:hypothetical protein